MGVVYYKSSTLSQSRETLKSCNMVFKSMMMRLLMPQRRRRQRMPPTERQLNLRLPRLKKKRPSLQKKTSSKIPTSLGHISIDYLDDEITVFWAINKKKYIL